jgi:hypothetical protein
MSLTMPERRLRSVQQSRIDRSTITLLHEQLDAIRRLDRQLGAIVVRDELNAKIRQVERFTAHSLAPGTREPLAGLLSEMHTLAGWQALDLGDVPDSWQHYEHSRSAAAQSNSISHESHAAAEQAFSSSTAELPATRSTSSTAPDVAPTQPHHSFCRHG